VQYIGGIRPIILNILSSNLGRQIEISLWESIVTSVIEVVEWHGCYSYGVRKFYGSL